MTAKSVLTTATIVNAVYRIALTGVLLFRLFRRRPAQPTYAY